MPGLDMVALREMIWRPLGMDSDNETDLPRTRIDLYLNRSFWSILNKFPFREKEKYAEFLTTIGERSYDMPYDSESLGSLAIVDPITFKHLDLDQITVDYYESIYSEDTVEQGKPIKYCREGCLFRLWPTPDLQYRMVIRRLINLSDLSNANPIPLIPREWHEIIGFGGLWRALSDFGDMGRMQTVKNTQAELINTLIPVQSKEESANVHHAGLEVLGREY